MKKKQWTLAAFLVGTNVLTYYATPHINFVIDVMRVKSGLEGDLRAQEYFPVNFENGGEQTAALPEAVETICDEEVYVIVSIPDRRMIFDAEKNQALAKSYIMGQDEASLSYSGMKLMLNRHNYGWHPLVKVKKR